MFCWNNFALFWQLPDWYNPLYFVAVMLLYTNSALNPIIYSGLNENFKNSFKSLCKTVFKKTREGTGRGRNSHKTAVHEMASHSHISTVHEKASHSHMSTVHDKISIMESRQGSKTSVIEGLDDEHSDTFRYTIAPNNHLNTFRNSIPWVNSANYTGHIGITTTCNCCWRMNTGLDVAFCLKVVNRMYKWIKLWCVLNQLIFRIVYSPW